jgi:hypothetical protein
MLPLPMGEGGVRGKCANSICQPFQAQHPQTNPAFWLGSTLFQRCVLHACVVAAFCLAGPARSAEPGTRNAVPRVFLLDAKTLQANRELIRQGDASLAPALAHLQKETREALTAGPFTVMAKTNTPPSGDKHDYISVAPYFWPNPNTKDGLPYIRRDGSRNAENRTLDRQNLGAMIGNFETLAFAYYFTGDEKSANRAALLLRTWFLDPATRMNPNLEFAQAVPGVNSGRGIGLIETAGLSSLVDAVGLLSGSKALTEADQRGLQAWFSEYLRWMQESKNGRDEAAAKNNHGTHYDVQVTSFALFVGKSDIATNILKAAGQKRIARQIEPDGRQPLELDRTNAWGYCTMNLRGLMSLATLGEKVGVDLWHYETPDGRSIRKALDCLVEYAENKREWLPGRSGRPSLSSLGPLLRNAAARYPEAPYNELLKKLPAGDPSDRSNLLRPRSAPQKGESK